MTRSSPRSGWWSAAVAAALVAPAPPAAAGEFDGWHFPPPGEGLDRQSRKAPAAVGLDPKVVDALKGKASRWALWRHGHLVHAEGDWNKTQDVASLRKTWHALTVGAAIGQGRVPSLHQRLDVWQPDLKGRDAAATWWHVITQSSAFDFPSDTHRDLGDPRPGEVWTYSDKNLVRLCNALAKVYGKTDFRDGYADVLKAAYFDAIGMRGWSTKAIDDGVRLVLDLEDMGRLGLLVLARGAWDGKQLVPRWFVEELERKQTHGMRPVYDGPDDGNVGQGWFHENRAKFPEAPYGFMTWVNTAGDLYPGADRAWAYAAGRGGTRVLWNHRLGIVYAGVDVSEKPAAAGLANLIEANVTGPNPLVKAGDRPAPAADPKDAKPVGRWDRFEAAVENPKRYADPYRDVSLDVTYTRPDGTAVKFWGFHDGGAAWKVRFMPDQLGVWKYEATFSDGSAGTNGTFRCVPSGVPGVVSAYEPNPVWFGFRDGHGGSPLLVRSLHVGDRFFAANWEPAKRAAFLDWAEGQGYNTLSVASFFLNRDADGRGKGWETPKLWPPDAAEYRKAEAVLDDLSRRRMAVFPFAGFFGRAADFPKDSKDQELYVRYALARFGPYWNVVLNVGGPEPLLRNKTYLSADDVHRLGRLVRRVDVFGHPLTVHNPTGDDAFKDADWLTFGTLQGPKTADRARLAAGLLKNHHPGKPLYAQETLWAGNDRGHPRYTDDDLRKNAFVIGMSGAALNFGDMAGDSSSGFSGTLDPADKVQARHDTVRRVWDVFETVPYHRTRPRPDLVDAGYCLADEGNDYLVYLESPGKVSVKVRGGPYRVEWIDARKPTDRRAGGTTADGRGLAPPAGGDDWLLRLTAGSAGGRD